MASEYVKVDDGVDIFGKRWEVGARGDVLVVTVSPTAIKLHFDDEDGGRSRFAEAVARATTPGQAGACRRPCCDHCNNREGDPAAHDYVPGGSPHDGPCEQCAAEQTCEGGC